MSDKVMVLTDVEWDMGTDAATEFLSAVNKMAKEPYLKSMSYEHFVIVKLEDGLLIKVDKEFYT